MENRYEYDGGNVPCQSEYGQLKCLQQTLNKNNDFILSLVMSYVGSRFKLLRMY